MVRSRLLHAHTLRAEIFQMHQMLRLVTTHRLITMFTSILLQIEIYIGKPDNTKEPVGNRQALLI